MDNYHYYIRKLISLYNPINRNWSNVFWYRVYQDARELISGVYTKRNYFRIVIVYNHDVTQGRR